MGKVKTIFIFYYLSFLFSRKKDGGESVDERFLVENLGYKFRLDA